MAGTMRCCVLDPPGATCLNGVRPRWPEQFAPGPPRPPPECGVSMESGLDGRNNHGRGNVLAFREEVSMESGLDGRNNAYNLDEQKLHIDVSMESGLDGRNNE